MQFIWCNEKMADENGGLEDDGFDDYWAACQRLSEIQEKDELGLICREYVWAHPHELNDYAADRWKAWMPVLHNGKVLMERKQIADDGELRDLLLGEPGMSNDDVSKQQHKDSRDHEWEKELLGLDIQEYAWVAPDNLSAYAAERWKVTYLPVWHDGKLLMERKQLTDETELRGMLG